MLKADLGTDIDLPIAHFTCAPGVLDISDALIAAGVRATPLECGYEYAINLDGSNSYRSNFMTEAIRDCAVDEAILEILDTSPQQLDELFIVLFEMQANGDQLNESFPAVNEWIEKRGLPDTRCIEELVHSDAVTQRGG